MYKNYTIVEGYEILKNSESKSLVKQHLSEDVFKLLCDKKSSFKSDLLDVIKSGVLNLDSNVGVYLPDHDSYVVFAPLLDKIIRQYHRIPADMPMVQPPYDFGDLDKFKNLDPDGNYIISTRISLVRNLKTMPFNTLMSETDYLELEQLVCKVTEGFTDDMKGMYLSLSEMTLETKKDLIDQHLLKENNRFLEAANALRFWPKGRGIFMNDAKTFLILVGEEDHIKMISMQEGDDLIEVAKRLKKGCDMFSEHFDFAHSTKLGFLSFSPTNLGTGIKCSVHIKLPKLCKDMKIFESIAASNYLQIECVYGEQSESEGGIYDVSNKKSYGINEYEVIADMHHSIESMIEQEKSL